MLIEGLVGTAIFYLFAGVTVLSAVMVVASRNAVHSVLFLILAFFNAAGLFVLAGAAFIAMLLVIVYVGAVAVLFLFVVMMLETSAPADSLRKGLQRYTGIGLTVGAILLAELIIFVGGRAAQGVSPAVQDGEPVNNTVEIGKLMYTDYFALFQLAGLVLLVAMIGAIVLTMRTRTGVRRQSISEQVKRTREESVAIRKVDSGAGVG